MLTLIFVGVAILTFACYKAKKLFLYKLFGGFSKILGMIVIGFWMMYIIDICTKPDLNECRKNCEIAQEKMQQLKKELIQADVLNEKVIDQFLENYQKLEDEYQENNAVIEDKSFEFEQGGIERIEFLLFFNLF